MYHAIKRMLLSACLFTSLPIEGTLAGSGDFLGLVTGSPRGTYIKIGRDIKNLVAGPAGISIRVIESGGSMENIRLLTEEDENAILAVVQSDVLSTLRNLSNPAADRKLEQLRLIYPLYNEEIHLFADKSIKRLHDLIGKRVSIGTANSGSAMTAFNLFKLADIDYTEDLIIENLSPEEAVPKILNGQLAAMLYVGGKPYEILNTNLMRLKDAPPEVRAALDNVHFVPLDNPEFMEQGEYVAAELTPADYPWLKATIPTLAVKALLVSLDFSAQTNAFQSARCQQLEKLGRALIDSQEMLRRQGEAKHKWIEVRLEEVPGVWKLDECAHVGNPTKQKFSEEMLLEALGIKHD